VSHFNAYKNTAQGAFSYQPALKGVFSNMKMFDNAKGFGIQLASGQLYDYNNDARIEMNNNFFIGETPMPDCPNERNGDYCSKIDKYAVLPGIFTMAGK